MDNHIHLKNKRQEGKTGLFWGWSQWVKEGRKKGCEMVNMMDVFCIHI
jgi:hypothetical protein